MNLNKIAILSALTISCGCTDRGETPYEPSMPGPGYERVAFRIDGFKPDSLWILGISGFCHENKSRLTAAAYGDSAFIVELPIPGKRSNIVTVEKTDTSIFQQYNVRSVLTIDGREYTLDCEMQIHIIYEYIADFRWHANSVKWAGEDAPLRKRVAYPSEILLRRDDDGRLRPARWD